MTLTFQGASIDVFYNAVSKVKTRDRADKTMIRFSKQHINIDVPKT